MKHVFLLKSEGTTHSFLPTIHQIMKGYDYDIHIYRSDETGMVSIVYYGKDNYIYQ